MRSRTFLEPASHSVDSYVVTDIDSAYLTLKIADCGNSISLEFQTSTGRKRTTARNKLRKLQGALDEISAAIESASP